jgi:hypothetical protein
MLLLRIFAYERLVHRQSIFASLLQTFCKCKTALGFSFAFLAVARSSQKQNSQYMAQFCF